MQHEPGLSHKLLLSSRLDGVRSLERQCAHETG